MRLAVKKISIIMFSLNSSYVLRCVIDHMKLVQCAWKVKEYIKADQLDSLKKICIICI